MDDFMYRESLRSCYSLAHTIAANGMMQQKLVNDLKDCESDITASKESIVKAMLRVLFSNFS
jgi:hypothetical protein